MYMNRKYQIKNYIINHEQYKRANQLGGTIQAANRR